MIYNEKYDMIHFSFIRIHTLRDTNKEKTAKLS